MQCLEDMKQLKVLWRLLALYLSTKMNNLHRSGFLMLMVKKLCKREIKVWIFVAGLQQMLYKNVFMFICGKLLGKFREVFFLLPRREQ